MKEETITRIFVSIFGLCFLLLVYLMVGFGDAIYFAWILLMVIVEKFMNAYFIPSKWAFKNRFRINEAIMCFSLALILVIKDYIQPKGFSATDFVGILVTALILFLIVCFSGGRNFKNKFKTDVFKLLSESSKLFDLAIYKSETENYSGKLVLTKQRLFFYTDNIDTPLFDYNLLEQKPVVKKLKKWGILSGIIINDDIKISITYPRLWLKKIKECL